MSQDLFRRQHGVASRGQLLATGISKNTITNRVRTGTWERVERGVYRHNAVPWTWEASQLTHVLATGGVASHRAAIRLWGLDDGRFDTVELSVPRGRTHRRPKVVTHELTQMHLDTPVLVSGIPTSTVERSVLDVGAVVRFGQLEMIADAAIRDRVTTWPRLHEVLTLHSRRGRNGCGRLRALLEERYGDPEVPLSRWGREVARWVVATDLPRARVEWRVVDAFGNFVAQVDLGWPRYQLALELDSVRYHLDRRSFEDDRRRHNSIEAVGWTVLHCTWDMWVNDRAELRRRIWECMTAATTEPAA